MTAATSLLYFILNLLQDPQAQEQFRASPEQVLAANGLTGVSAADIRETLPLVTDHRFVELNGSNHIVWPSVVPPAGDSDIRAAIHYLHHITRTYRYDDHGTHAHDPGHGNIWAVGDVTHTFDDGHVAAGGPAPGPGDAPGTGHWMGGGHENFGDENSGHNSNFIYGDHIHGLSYADTQDDPAGSSSGSAFRHPGHDLHSFGSGAAMTSAGGTGSPTAYFGDTAGSHGSTGLHPADSGTAASQASPDDFHTHDAHSFGDASYGQDSYYGQDTEHGIHDPSEPHIYLDLH
jgi:hypothetical protein